MEIISQIVNGQLDGSNKFCIHWNQLGEIAYACQNSIVIIDSYSMKITNSFTSPKGMVTKLQWSSLNLNANSNKSFLKLAFADDGLSIVIWNTFEKKMINELVESNMPNQKIYEIKWLNDESNSNEFLVALYSNYKLVIWDTLKGVKLLNKQFSESITHFALDTYDFGRIALLGSNFIQFTSFEHEKEIFSEKKSKKFYITNQDGLDSSDDNKKTINLITSYWKNFIDGSQKASDSNFPKMSLKDCFQIEFHSAIKNIIYLIYPKEIFIFELNINQTIGYISIDKYTSAFVQLYNCTQSDVLFLLHDNGSTSVYQKDDIFDKEYFQSKINIDNSIDDTFENLTKSFNYNLIIQSDQIRLSKNSQVFGFSVCPVSQKKFCILLSDGRILKYDLYQKDVRSLVERKNNLLTTHLFLFELSLLKTPRENLKICLSGVTNVIYESPSLFKVGPPLTKKNFKNWSPLLAVGCSNGNLYIYNLNKNLIVKKLLLYNHPIMGAEWLSINCLLTWSWYNVSSSQNSNTNESSSSANSKQQFVKNEIFLTDLRTGESRSFREDFNEESPIVSAKLSILKQYLVIIFKDQPLEIWDIRNFSLIKKISKKSPIIKVLALETLFFKEITTHIPTDQATVFPLQEQALYLQIGLFF